MTWPQYRRRECRYKGWLTRLSPQQAEVLSVLLIRGERPTPAGLLADAVWHDAPDGGALWAVDIIRTIIGQLRAKLPGAIGGRVDFGYYLKGGAA